MSSEQTADLLQKLSSNNLYAHYEADRHRIRYESQSREELLSLRLPLTMWPPGRAADKQNTKVNYVILLIQSGSCAMGYFEQGVNLDHKVFRAYMVRKKQGKSQIKHLKTKGKSRAGSRVRLGESLEFFENINERLQQYFQQHPIDRIALSCSKILLPYLFNAKVPTPFGKKDERLLKIPKHIHTPIYEVLLDTNKFLLKGELAYADSRQEQVRELLGNTFIP